MGEEQQGQRGAGPSLGVVRVNGMEEALQLWAAEHTISEEKLELIQGQPPIICGEHRNAGPDPEPRGPHCTDTPTLCCSGKEAPRVGIQGDCGEQLLLRLCAGITLSHTQ